MSELPASNAPSPSDSYRSQPTDSFRPSGPSPSIEEPLVPASVKPLLNPLQDGNAPSASTVAQPPRSPNPLNPATDGEGNNLHLPPSLPSTAAPSPAVLTPSEVPFPGAGNITPALPSEEVVEPSSAANAVNGELEAAAAAPLVDQPPLPIDAPVPPSPQAADEPPPLLPPGSIPPAVPTPDVIITPGREAAEEAPPAPLEAAAPAPTESEPAPIPEPAPTVAAVPEAPQEEHVSSDAIGEAMDVDVDAAGEVEETEPKPAVETSETNGSLKRAGDELDGPEEKRLREETNGFEAAPPAAPSAPAQSAPPAAAYSVPMPIIPEGAPRPAWEFYQEPAPRPAGPTTPLTQTQVKHLLAAIRNMKKNPNALGFLEPVDVIRFGIPHYFNVVQKPMDLGTVEMKLIMSDPRGPPKDRSKLKAYTPEMGAYGSVADVAGDVRQIWENTRKFNGKDHVVSQAADKLDQMFEKQLSSLPAEPSAAPQPVAGPSSSPAPAARRPSVSQPPVIHRSSDGAGDRPKREIHAPPPKDLIYSETTSRKPKRRNDPQLQWALKTIKSLESSTTKNYELVAPFLYPVGDIIRDLPDYAKIIKRPIDLNIIKSKIEEGSYNDASQVNSDVRLMISNAQQFNPPTHDVHVAAKKLLQVWQEKWAGLPAKVEVRDESEDPLADDDDEMDEEEGFLAELVGKHARLESEIADVEARIAKRKAARKKSKATKARKQSTAGRPSAASTNGQAKKPKKTKEPRYRDDEESEEEEVQELTSSQKTDLAEKIGDVDGPMLEKIIGMIKRATKIPDDSEIELDIDSLPRSLIWQLYKMVVRPDLLNKRRQSAPLKKPGRKPGGPSRNRLDEDREEERIQAMKRQLKEMQDGGFDQGAAGQSGYDSESSEEESSDEE